MVVLRKLIDMGLASSYGAGYSGCAGDGDEDSSADASILSPPPPFHPSTRLLPFHQRHPPQPSIRPSAQRADRLPPDDEKDIATKRVDGRLTSPCVGPAAEATEHPVQLEQMT